jgi:ATP-binding cassette subfamily D (ALD) long-chain fatty acid import protein
VAGNGKEFLKGLGYWFAIAVPATYTNSMIRYLQSKLAIAFRTRLTDYVHDKYLEDIVFYKLLNLDSRIAGPDQLICTDISRFCDTLSSLYSNLAKPVLDTIIFNYQLTKSIGGSGMFAIGVNYLITAWILRQVTPGFGKLAAVEAKLEGDFRSAHSRLITNAEEIAFYHGGERECGILESIYKTLIRHVNRIYRIRIAYNMFEDFVIKYTWSAVGLLVCAVPVFFPDWAGTRSVKSLGGGGNASSHTQGFITNKRYAIISNHCLD